MQDLRHRYPCAKDSWVAEDLAPIIDHCFDVFGPDRVLFASDWSVCTLRATFHQWVTALRKIVRGRSEQDRRKVFAENAIRVYGLDVS